MLHTKVVDIKDKKLSIIDAEKFIKDARAQGISKAAIKIILEKEWNKILNS